MKRSMLCAAVAALTLAGASAIAEDVPAKPASAPERSKVWDAFMAMAQDFEDIMEGKGNPVAKLDGLVAARQAPQTAAAVSAVFGTDHPYTIARIPAPKGQAGFKARVEPVAYLDPNGSRIEWAALDALMTFDASGRSMSMKGSWPSVLAEDGDVRITARDISFAGGQKRGFANLWFGTFELRIPQLRVESRTGSGIDLALADTSIACSVVERGKLADINYKVSGRATGAAGERVGGFILAARLANLDAKAMAEVGEKLRKDSKGKTLEQREADSLPILKEFLRQSATRGSAMIIDELRASYHGNTATLKGRISVEGRGAVAIDASLLTRILARFTVRVPVPMIQEFAAATARQQMAASAPGQPVSEQAVAQVAQTITDTIVGQALAKGYARIDKDYLESNLEFRNGVLRVNGKEVALPDFGPAPGAVPAAPVALSPVAAPAPH